MVFSLIQLHTRLSSRSVQLLLAVIMFAAGVLLAGCTSGDGTQTPTANTTETSAAQVTQQPTLTPTPEPLGSPANPFILATVSEEEDEKVAAAVQELARRLGESAQAAVEGRVYSGYAELLDDMENGDVHITWMPPLTYLYASQRGLAEVALLTNHFGVYQYGTQFMANVSSGFTPYFDPISGLTSADAATALAQFEGMRPCWVEPLSPSGYIVPAGLLKTNQISVLPPVMAQNHTAVVRALYIKGICDFGATFSITGDPRTALAVLQDLPDAMDRVIIIWRTEGTIPNLDVAYIAGLSERDRQNLTTAFLDIARTQEGKALLSVAANNYQIDDIKAVEDTVYDPLRALVDALNINLKDLIGK